MKKLLAVLVLILCEVYFSTTLSQAQTAYTLSGFGTAKIDGILSEGEWDYAGQLQFDVTVSESEKVLSTVYFMHDEKNLYFALRVPKGLNSTNFVILLDASGDHWFGAGDDVIGGSLNEWGGLHYGDTWYYSAGANGEYVYNGYDVSLGGTSDINFAGTLSPESTFIEISHPINSGDPFDLAAIPPIDIKAGLLIQVAPLGGPYVGNNTSFGYINDYQHDLRIHISDVPGLLDSLRSIVNSFGKRNGATNALDNKLVAIQAAVQNLKQGDNAAAFNQLTAFMNTVLAQRGKELTTQQADTLLLFAKQIQDLLAK